MTFQRILSRNKLRDGGYEVLPMGWSEANFSAYGGGWSKDEKVLLDQINRERGEWGDRIRLLAGDLRRLEEDAVDERGICRYIASRIRLTDEAVAVVLKEFMAW